MTPRASLLVPGEALAQLPAQLRDDLLGAFGQIVANFSESRWEPAELNGGKLSEAAYSICSGLCSGAMPDRAHKPRNMVLACQDLERDYPDASRSPRIQVPRMIVALYEIRNNRGVGHLGGDVDPNHMDAACVLQMSKWIVAELVRILHELPISEASEIVDALVEREVPLVWKVGGKRRVLDPGMTTTDKTLLLLHGCPGAAAEADLADWVEHPTIAHYRRDVLRRLHRAKLIEYDPIARTAILSPLGITHVESKIIATAG